MDVFVNTRTAIMMRQAAEHYGAETNKMGCFTVSGSVCGCCAIICIFWSVAGQIYPSCGEKIHGTMKKYQVALIETTGENKNVVREHITGMVTRRVFQRSTLKQLTDAKFKMRMCIHCSCSRSYSKISFGCVSPVFRKREVAY